MSMILFHIHKPFNKISAATKLTSIHQLLIIRTLSTGWLNLSLTFTPFERFHSGSKFIVNYDLVRGKIILLRSDYNQANLDVLVMIFKYIYLIT